MIWLHTMKIMHRPLLSRNNGCLCYVLFFLQDDVVTGSLTVRENLHFSAALRLPSQMTHAQRKERVDRVIEELGLKNCSEQQVPAYWSYMLIYIIVRPWLLGF